MSAEEQAGRAGKIAAGVRHGERLGPAEHVRGREAFAVLRARGRRGGDAVLRVLVALNGLGHSRCGMAVSRRYGNAPARNRLRRLYREAFRLEKAQIPRGIDVLISPSRGAGEPTLDQVRASLTAATQQVTKRLLRKGGAR